MLIPNLEKLFSKPALNLILFIKRLSSLIFNVLETLNIFLYLFTKSNLQFDCLIFSVESIVMLVLSEIFHDRSESFNLYFYDIGLWAGALVTILCSCFYVMTINFLHPRDLFEKVRKEKFSVLIFKQINFCLSSLALSVWLLSYLILKNQII